jgi:hypothetical protein
MGFSTKGKKPFNGVRCFLWKIRFLKENVWMWLAIHGIWRIVYAVTELKAKGA